MKFSAIIVLTFITTSTFGQNLSSEIDDIYNFQPSKLSDKEQESKFPALDQFWNKVQLRYCPIKCVFTKLAHK